MKREHISKVGRKPVQAEVIEEQTDQGVNGTATASRVDLREAVVGEYRFQGTLVRAFYIAGRTWLSNRFQSCPPFRAQM